MSSTDTAFTTKLKTRREEIDQAIKRYYESVDMQRFSRHGEEAWTMVREFSERPGKRIRGSLLMAAYEMYGGTKPEEAMKAAIAIELIQNYLLIIDDVMDRSAMRRGKPTVQYMYYDRLQSLVGEDLHHMGDMLAINVGLLAAHAAAELVNSVDHDADRIVAANEVFHRNIQATVFGQVNDLFSGLDQTSEEDILLTHELKSSYYTFINPMQVGALLAGAGKSDCDLIATFGTPAGIAFQLQDDIIGLFGEPNVTGKSYLDDLKEGKHTLIIQQALQRTDKAGAVVITEALGNHAITDAQADIVRKVIIDCGAKQYAEDMARNFADQAKKTVHTSNWPEEHKAFLDDLMTFIVERLA